MPTPGIAPATLAAAAGTADPGIDISALVAGPTATVPVASEPAPTEPTVPSPNNGGQLRISHRVLVHIASQGRIGRDELAPRALTQAGMVEALSVNQGALTGVLRRLVAAGVLEESREHVHGADRRLKVYRLTSSGVELYRDLRTRRPP